MSVCLQEGECRGAEIAASCASTGSLAALTQSWGMLKKQERQSNMTAVRVSVNGQKLARSMSPGYADWIQNAYLRSTCQYQPCSTVHESSAH